jgi:hypothetical protein
MGARRGIGQALGREPDLVERGFDVTDGALGAFRLPGVALADSRSEHHDMGVQAGPQAPLGWVERQQGRVGRAGACAHGDQSE